MATGNLTTTGADDDGGERASFIFLTCWRSSSSSIINGTGGRLTSHVIREQNERRGLADKGGGVTACTFMFLDENLINKHV